MMAQVSTALDFKVMRETLRGNFEAFKNDYGGTYTDDALTRCLKSGFQIFSLVKMLGDHDQHTLDMFIPSRLSVEDRQTSRDTSMDLPIDEDNSRKRSSSILGGLSGMTSAVTGGLTRMGSAVTGGFFGSNAGYEDDQPKKVWTYEQAYDFFNKYTGSVELMIDDKLQRAYFPIPPACSRLTSQVKAETEWALNRSNAAEKVTDLCRQFAHLYERMQHEQRMHDDETLKGRILVKVVQQKSRMMLLSFVLALVVNMLLLGFETVVDGTFDSKPVLMDWVVSDVLTLNIDQIVTGMLH